MVEAIDRFDIILVQLNPTVGSEIQKTRPCIVVSPNQMSALNTLIVAPMTSKGFDFVFRPKIKFDNKVGLVLLDQIRAVDKTRVIKKLGQLSPSKAKQIAHTLTQMFEY